MDDDVGRPGRGSGPSPPARGRAPEPVGVVGCGRMGRALAAALSARGVDVVVAARTLGRAREVAVGPHLSAGTVREVVDAAWVVVLAVPVRPMLAELPDLIRPVLRDQVLVDPSNPDLDQEPGRWPSAAERLTGLLPGVPVAKAFNTIAARDLGAGAAPLPVATDSTRALTRVFTLARSLGLRPVDAGPLDSARTLEAAAGILRRVAAGRGGDPGPCHPQFPVDTADARARRAARSLYHRRPNDWSASGRSRSGREGRR